MDFTSFSLEAAKDGEDRMVYVQDLILVMEFIEEGQRRTEYIDYICDAKDNNKNDFFFVLYVFILFFSTYFISGGFDSIEIWSDGGPHHFKTRFCQWTWHHLSSLFFSSKRITHNFFASYHGHSLADAHAATDKRLLRDAYNASQHDRLSVTEASLNFGPSSAQDLSVLLSSPASRTSVFHLPSIPRDPELRPHILPLSLIKSKHSFVYENGACYAVEQTNKGPDQRFFFHTLV